LCWRKMPTTKYFPTRTFSVFGPEDLVSSGDRLFTDLLEVDMGLPIIHHHGVVSHFRTIMGFCFAITRIWLELFRKASPGVN